MPLMLLPAWAALRGWFLVGVAFLKGLPAWFWYIVAGVVALMLYSHWYGNKVRLEQRVKIEQATRKEVVRQTQVTSNALTEAAGRAIDLQTQLNRTKQELENAQDAIRKSADARRVCLPESFTDQLRKQRGAPGYRRP